MEAFGSGTSTATTGSGEAQVNRLEHFAARLERMSDVNDVVIVGGGVIGLSIAYALARGDHEHGSGSSRARSRGFVGWCRSDRAHE